MHFISSFLTALVQNPFDALLGLTMCICVFCLFTTSVFNIFFYLLKMRNLNRKCIYIPLLSLLFIAVNLLMPVLYHDALQQFGLTYVVYPLIHISCWIGAMRLIPKNGNKPEKILQQSAKIHLVSIIILPIAAAIFAAKNG